jgi:hypothetical protein
MNSPGVRLRNGKKLRDVPMAKRVYQRKGSSQSKDSLLHAFLGLTFF